MNEIIQTEIFPPLKKPKPKQDRAITGKILLKKRYAEVDLGPYTDQVGDMEGKCTLMLSGPGGSGKSVYALILANWLAGKYGKVLYNSHEEKHNKTLQTRVREWLHIDGDNPLNQKMYFAPAWNFDTLMAKIKTNKYRVVVIDSVQYAKFTYDQLIELRDTYRKRNIILILISFGNGIDKTDGADKLLYAADIKMFFKNGRLKVLSRYLSEPFKKVLFQPNAKEGLMKL